MRSFEVPTGFRLCTLGAQRIMTSFEPFRVVEALESAEKFDPGISAGRCWRLEATIRVAIIPRDWDAAVTGELPMNERTRGEAEDAFTKAIIKFEKEQLGRGPKDARTYFIGDMIVVRLTGLLTSAASMLARQQEGQELIKVTKRRLPLKLS